MPINIVNYDPDSGEPTIPLFPDLDSTVPGASITLPQIFLVGALVISHLLTGYPLSRILARFTISQLVTAGRELWQWHMIMSLKDIGPRGEGL